MKTAEEWIIKLNGAYDLVVSVTRQEIEDIQLDAFKAGMTKAANVAAARQIHGGISDEDDIRDYDQAASLIYRRILKSRDEKVKV